MEIDPPAGSITTAQSFKDSINASSAIAGIYFNMANNLGGLTFANGATTINAGCSADELVPFTSNDQFVFYTNTLIQAQDNTSSYFWDPAYFNIYQANSSLEGLQASTGISSSAKDLFIGEAKFLRALAYFYLINLYGDVPLLTSSDYHANSLAKRTAVNLVYQQIVSDLKDAQSKLRADYTLSGNERIRANKWAATALLARVYLYMGAGHYADAETQASSIIENTALFNLVSDLNNVFLRNSSESILQWQVNSSLSPLYNVTTEGYNIIPLDSTYNPNFTISPQLMAAFEPSDKRKTAWIDSTNYFGQLYYFPYKYKVGQAQTMQGAPPAEYYTVLRLAEQYLIRAEARAQLGELAAAITDLNIIRARAGLPNLSSGLSQTQVLAAVAQERRIELFAEWGHRWLDLKRTGQIDAVMSVVTPTKNGGGAWQSFQQLYPIPQGERTADPNLIQNPGY